MQIKYQLIRTSYQGIHREILKESCLVNAKCLLNRNTLIIGIDHPPAINSSITRLDRYVIYDMFFSVHIYLIVCQYKLSKFLLSLKYEFIGKKSKRKFSNQLTINRVVFLAFFKRGLITQARKTLQNPNLQIEVSPLWMDQKKRSKP